MNNYFNYNKARELIEAKGGLDRIAVQLDIARATLYNYTTKTEKGRKEPPLWVLIELSNILEIEPGELITIPLKIKISKEDNIKSSPDNYCLECIKKDGVIEHLKDRITDLEELCDSNNIRHPYKTKRA